MWFQHISTCFNRPTFGCRWPSPIVSVSFGFIFTRLHNCQACHFLKPWRSETSSLVWSLTWRSMFFGKTLMANESKMMAIRGRWTNHRGFARKKWVYPLVIQHVRGSSTCLWKVKKSIGKSSTNGIKWAIRQAMLNYSTKGYRFQDANHWLLEAPTFPMEGQGMHGKQTTTYKQPYQVQQ